MRRQCEGAKRSGGLWKSGKVSAAGGRERTEYRVRRTEDGRSPREAARLARSANPTRGRVKGERGPGCWQAAGAVSELSSR